jgi:hypothetical protein
MKLTTEIPEVTEEDALPLRTRDEFIISEGEVSGL